MAWIKIETTTPDKPEIHAIARLLKIEPDLVLGKIVRLWAWADLNMMGGNSVMGDDALVDHVVHRKGFAKAMRKVGWLEGDDGGLSFPRFERHNGETAKARAESARRMAKSRAGRNNGCENGATSLQQKQQLEKEKEYYPTDNKKSAIDYAALIPGIVALYPRREKVEEACQAVAKAIRAGHSPETIADGTRAMAAAISQLPGGALNKFVPSAGSFFANKRWADDPKTLLRQIGTQSGPAGPVNTHGRDPSRTVKISPHTK